MTSTKLIPDESNDHGRQKAGHRRGGEARAPPTNGPKGAGRSRRWGPVGLPATTPHLRGAAWDGRRRSMLYSINKYLRRRLTATTAGGRCASRRSPSRRIQPERWQDDRLAAHHCHCGITVARQLTPRPHCPGGREGVASFCAFKGMSSTPRHATTQTIPARGGPYHHSSAVGWLASRAGLLKAAGASWNWPGEGDDISSCEALCWRSVMSSCNNIIYRKVCARYPLKSTRGHLCPGPFARAGGNQCPD